MTSEETISSGTNKNNNNAGRLLSPNDKLEDQDQDQQQQQDDEQKIEKAIQFWNHPSLKNVTSEEKRAYLHKRGLTDDLIHKAWDRMLEREQQQIPSNNNNNNFDTVPNNPSSLSANNNNLPPNQRPSGNNNISYDGHGVSHNNHARQGPSFHPTSTYPASTYPQHQQAYPQHQQQQQHYPSPYYPPMEDMDDDPAISVAQGLSLVAVGGMLGVTAAAAVRWLNGGDFELFPSPVAATTAANAITGRIASDPTANEVDQALGRNVGNEEEEEDEAFQEGVEDTAEDDNDEQGYDEYDIDDDDDDNDGRIQPLADKMDQLLQAVSTNTETQEKLMRKIANNASTITNQSMDLLRNSQTPQQKKRNPTDLSETDRAVLLSQLTEIAADLNKVRTAGITNQEWEEDTAKILKKLEQSIDLLKIKSDTLSDNEDTTPSTNAASDTSVSASQPQSSPSTPGEVRWSNENEQVGTTTTSSNSPTKSLHDCIRQIVTGNDASTLKVGTQLLYLYLVNLSGKPDNPRYRKIFTSNQSFQKVECLAGGRELLYAVGFEKDETKSVLEWLPSSSCNNDDDNDNEAAALMLVKEATSALGVLKSGIPSAELTERALSKLTLSATNMETTTTPPTPPRTIENITQEVEEEVVDEENEKTMMWTMPTSDEDVAPQTPAGSMLMSPPATKKLPFPQGTPTNLSDLLERSSTPAVVTTTEEE
ncbi:PUB domain containing protein [Nitzschia inconspicua]|uniref:PUB domain containing protein n=1 Tax=Nitzschia inconspicua TaxID=303405 RepID=A0A9K3PZI2_9STRA|nr:PUB domain containing protein [Nitzschia inconspicua]